MSSACRAPDSPLPLSRLNTLTARSAVAQKMAPAKDLEIYKAADQLLALSLRLQTQVPRAYRVAVGQRISNECADILLTVARANAARGTSREAHISSLLERLEAASALLRASHGLRLISSKV